ncbi:MAG: hypothetical protein H0X64_14250, partial [Gemmatimonadaceae bacterium]|nr:hypothetical protein [Gemmatimonadaceae bacterium]
GFRLATRTRVEGAGVDIADSSSIGGYGRVMFDGTLSRGFGRFAAAVTGAAGTGVGTVTPQRLFYMGGLHSVRGQLARPVAVPGEPRVGDTFWLGRGEVGRGWPMFRTVAFYDVGWAGERADFASPGRPMSGAGFGVSLLDATVRADVSKGIWPDKGWRFDMYLGGRF